MQGDSLKPHYLYLETINYVRVLTELLECDFGLSARAGEIQRTLKQTSFDHGGDPRSLLNMARPLTSFKFIYTVALG
jgi:hypothetical protein